MNRKKIRGFLIKNGYAEKDVLSMTHLKRLELVKKIFDKLYNKTGEK